MLKEGATLTVITGLDPVIPRLGCPDRSGADGRIKSGHDIRG
jgi:hypothetical protein